MLTCGTRNKKEKPLITQTKPVPVNNDVFPGSNRAVLILSDGRKVELTPVTRSIAEKGTDIRNTNGRLEYGKAQQSGIQYHVHSLAAASTQLTLPDGTNVWLNAACSITYPTAFINNTAKSPLPVKCILKWKKNPSKPFVVKTRKEEITVLGTQFNVNTYADEPVTKTSLLEGSVQSSR